MRSSALRASCRLAVVLLSGLLVTSVAGCGGEPDAGTGGNPSSDKLAQIESRGTLILPTDTAYPPASFAVENGRRRSDTLCAANQLTAPEVDGYDVAVGKALAEELGVEPCFVTPTWSELIGGNWNDRWDIAFSSIGITRGRMGDLVFTMPYYATPEHFYVRRDGPYARIGQLEGTRIGVCTGCFADLYLRHQLDLPGSSVTYELDRAQIIGYAVERDGLDDVAAGQLDAFLCQETAGDQAIAEGLALQPLAPAAYTAFIGGAIDRSAPVALRSFFDRVNQVIRDLHERGTLRDFSQTYFGKDYASSAAAFDFDSVEQVVE